jgi:predicted RNA methylase
MENNHPNIKTQKKGLNRNTIDKYYTKDAVVDLCLNYVKKHIKIYSEDLIIEPSAGNGSFIKGIKLITNNFKFYDLEPDNDEIIKQDYLTYNYDEIKENFNKIHIIGNPPFGRQSSLANKFIKKSCEFCDTISFILPKSFKKDSLKKIFPLNFHLVFEIDLPEKSFLVDKIEHNVPCIFQIWEKRTFNRDTNEKIEPINFLFVKKTENPDISFRRVGVNAGTIDEKIDDKSIQSHYFIKFTNGKTITDNINKLSTIIFNFDNTVGPKSISKQELIIKFNPLLECNKELEQKVIEQKYSITESDLTIEYINKRIKQEVCYKTLEQLNDANLINEYMGCNSVKNEIKKLSIILEKYIDEEIKQKIIQEYLLQLIPAGTKGVIRGNKFNNIIKQYITKLTLDTNRFEICFEKKCGLHLTTEIPDWYILEKATNKIIIGMNQLDLWSGGQQLNRGSKYIENNKHNNENSKLLCVICNEIELKSTKNKTYKIFETGFKNNTLCYLNNLQNIITIYFLEKSIAKK